MAATKPTVSNLKIDEIDRITTEVHFTVNSKGSATLSDVGFYFSLEPDAARTGSAITVTPAIAGTYSGTLTPLVSSTQYYVVAYATNSGGTVYTDELSFITDTYELKMKSVDKAKIILFTLNVPFNRQLTVCQAEVNATGFALIPVIDAADGKTPIPGATTIYRLYGDGTNAPRFSTIFKKTSLSEEYVNTKGVLNVVKFFYDGVDFWYTIWQEYSAPA